MQFSSKDIQLFNEAGINVEDKNYTNDEINKVEKQFLYEENLKLKQEIEKLQNNKRVRFRFSRFIQHRIIFTQSI